MTQLEEIFKKAEKYGIRRIEIGKKAFGTSYCCIYAKKNPTIKTLERIKKAADILINEKISQ